eukprot:gene7269-biopygen5
MPPWRPWQPGQGLGSPRDPGHPSPPGPPDPKGRGPCGPCSPCGPCGLCSTYQGRKCLQVHQHCQDTNKCGTVTGADMSQPWAGPAGGGETPPSPRKFGKMCRVLGERGWGAKGAQLPPPPGGRLMCREKVEESGGKWRKRGGKMTEKTGARTT